LEERVFSRAHYAPNQDEISALKGEIHGLIQEQVRVESEKGMGPLSILFPQQRQINSQTAHYILRELELSTETDTGLLRQWAQKLKSDPKKLNSLIRDYLPPKKKVFY